MSEIIKNLPAVENFKNYKMSYKVPVYTEETNYKIDDIKAFYQIIDKYIDTFVNGGLIEKLFTNDLLPRSEEYRFEMYNLLFKGKVKILYSKKQDSLVIELRNEKDELKTLSFREFKTKESNETIKWKTYGSKRFIPYKLKDNNKFCFVAFGMSEIILFELLEFDYFILQSDSIVHNLANNDYFKPVKEKLKDRVTYIFPDNDESGLKAGYKLNKYLKEEGLKSKVLELGKMTNKQLKKGYDLRDLINEYSKNEVIKMIIKGVKEAGNE